MYQLLTLNLGKKLWKVHTKKAIFAWGRVARRYKQIGEA